MNDTPERVVLAAAGPEARRRALVGGLFGALLFASALGGIAGLIGGRVAGLAVAAVVAVLVLYVVSYNVRRTVWLEGTALLVRTWGVRRVEMADVERIDLLVTDVRGVRTVALLITARGRGPSVKLDLASYSGAGARTLDLFALRKLANALMNAIEANGMVFAELLVAELRAEARGEGLVGRPFYRLAIAAPGGRLAQRYAPETVSKFVTTLD